MHEFGVGDPGRTGVLYWSKGSNLDSAPDTNQMDVTDPSEALVNGAMSVGLGVLFSVLPRVAAWAEAGMLTLFTLLVWGPAVLSAPRTRLPWTAFFISWSIASAAWVVAQSSLRKDLAKQLV